MVAVRDVVKVRRIGPTGATGRAGRAGLPGAQQLVTVGPVRAHRAVSGGRGTVGIVTGSTSAFVVIVHTDGRRAVSAGHVGSVFRAVVGGAGDSAIGVVNIVPLSDT